MYTLLHLRDEELTLAMAGGQELGQSHAPLAEMFPQVH